MDREKKVNFVEKHENKTVSTRTNLYKLQLNCINASTTLTQQGQQMKTEERKTGKDLLQLITYEQYEPNFRRRRRIRREQLVNLPPSWKGWEEGYVRNHNGEFL